MTYLPEDEAKEVRSRLLASVHAHQKAYGEMSLFVTVLLRPDDEGEAQVPVSFVLVKDGVGLAYESVGAVEINGVPGNRFRIPVDKVKKRSTKK